MQDRPADGDCYFSMHREVLTSVALIQQTNDTKICVCRGVKIIVIVWYSVFVRNLEDNEPPESTGE